MPEFANAALATIPATPPIPATSPIPAIADGTSLSTVMNLLLIRFGIIAAGIAVLAVIVFAIAVVLRRKGKLGTTMKQIAPLARSYADARNAAAANPYARRRKNRSGIVHTTAANAVARYLSEKGDQR
jgi:hypothetical protein